MRVRVWNEFVHEQTDEQVKAVYPDGIHQALAQGLSTRLGTSVATSTLEEPEHGLTEQALANTDVLLWWGHMAHHKVADAVVDAVFERVMQGMGLVVLHSGHLSKIFCKLMGTSCNLRWREADERELIWCVNPAHPIAQGVSFPSSCLSTRCTVSFLIFRNPMSWCLSVTLRGVKCFAVVVGFSGAKGAFSISHPGTRPILYFIQTLFCRCSATR